MAHSLAKTVVFLFSLLLLPSICFPLDPTVCGGQEKALLNFDRCDVDDAGFFDALLTKCAETCATSMDVSCRDVCVIHTSGTNCKKKLGLKMVLQKSCDKLNLVDGQKMTTEQCSGFVDECLNYINPSITDYLNGFFRRIVRDSTGQITISAIGQCYNSTAYVMVPGVQCGTQRATFLQIVPAFCNGYCKKNENCTKDCFVSSTIMQCKSQASEVLEGACVNGMTSFKSNSSCPQLKDVCLTEYKQGLLKTSKDFSKCQFSNARAADAFTFSANSSLYIDNVESACRGEADCFNKEITKLNDDVYMNESCPEATAKFLRGDEHLCEDLEGCFQEFYDRKYPTTTTSTTKISSAATTITTEVIENVPQKSNERQVEKKPATESHETKKEKWWREEKKKILTAYGYLWLMLLGVGLVLALFCVRIWFFQE